MAIFVWYMWLTLGSRLGKVCYGPTEKIIRGRFMIWCIPQQTFDRIYKTTKGIDARFQHCCHSAVDVNFLRLSIQGEIAVPWFSVSCECEPTLKAKGVWDILIESSGGESTIIEVQNWYVLLNGVSYLHNPSDLPMLKDEPYIVRFPQTPPYNTSITNVADWIPLVLHVSLTILARSKASTQPSPKSLTYSAHPLVPRPSIQAFYSWRTPSRSSHSYLQHAQISSRNSISQWKRSQIS